MEGNNMRPNVEAENHSQYWKWSLYLPFLDHLTTELTEKLVALLSGFQAQYLIPTNLPGLDGAWDEDMYHHYGHNMVDVQSWSS